MTKPLRCKRNTKVWRIWIAGDAIFFRLQRRDEAKFPLVYKILFSYFHYINHKAPILRKFLFDRITHDAN